MTYVEALPVAEHVRDLLAPHCERISIGGSIRRQKPTVKDIEIICIPKPYDIGLFASGIAPVVEQWPKVKGELPCKYTQRLLPGGKHHAHIALDLFMCEADNWGLILALRTGPGDWNQHWLLPKLARVGLTMRGGYLWRGSEQIRVREEEDLFSILNHPFVEPRDRYAP